MGYTNLREKKRKVGRKREENDSHGVNSEDKENVGALVTQSLTVFKDIRP